MDPDAPMLEIAKRFGIRLTDVAKHTKHIEADGIESYRNRSYIVGGYEIQLGIYDDPELRLLSFFHEVGHTLVGDKFKKRVAYDKYKIEKRAWKKEYKLAISYNIAFSDKAKQWAVGELSTYIERDRKEVISMSKFRNLVSRMLQEVRRIHPGSR